jgi:hypothetical protein
LSINNPSTYAVKGTEKRTDSNHCQADDTEPLPFTNVSASWSVTTPDGVAHSNSGTTASASSTVAGTATVTFTLTGTDPLGGPVTASITGTMTFKGANYGAPVVTTQPVMGAPPTIATQPTGVSLVGQPITFTANAPGAAIPGVSTSTDQNHCVADQITPIPVTVTTTWAVSGVIADHQTGTGLTATFTPSTTGTATVTFTTTGTSSVGGPYDGGYVQGSAAVINVTLSPSVPDVAVFSATSATVTIDNPSNATVTGVEVDVSADSLVLDNAQATKPVSATEEEPLIGIAASGSIGGSYVAVKFNGQPIASAYDTFTVFSIELPSIPSVILKGGNCGGTVTVLPDQYPVELDLGPSPSEAATFASPGSGEVYDITGTTNITINGTSASTFVGDDYLSASVNGNKIVATSAFTVVDIKVVASVPPFELWYFDGQLPRNYPTSVQVEVQTIPADYQNDDAWSWTADEHSNTNFTISPGFFDSRLCTIDATGTSASANDCLLDVQDAYNTGVKTVFSFTVDHLAPLTPNGSPTTTEVDGGVYAPDSETYLTTIPYTVSSTFGTPVLKHIELTENWNTSSYSCQAGCNWGILDAGNDEDFDPTTTADKIEAPIGVNTNLGSSGYGTTYTPQATGPQTPLTTTPIESWDGAWRMGITPPLLTNTLPFNVGPIVLQKKWVLFIDHGEHQAP